MFMNPRPTTDDQSSVRDHQKDVRCGHRYSNSCPSDHPQRNKLSRTSKRTLFDFRATDESIRDLYLIISWCPVLDNFLIVRHRYGIGQLFDVRNVNIASTDILLMTLWWSISDRFSMVPYGSILGSSFDFLSRTTFCNIRQPYQNWSLFDVLSMHIATTDIKLMTFS